MQGSHHGGRHDTGVSDRVDAVLGAGLANRVRWRPDQPGRQHHTGSVCQVKHMLESHHLHRAQHAGKFPDQLIFGTVRIVFSPRVLTRFVVFFSFL